MGVENRFGIDGKAYYGTAGSTPSTELTEAHKVSLKITLEEGEFPSRASAWKIADVAVMGAEVEITISNAVRNAAAINFFWNAALTRTPVAVKVLDAATGSRGIDADWMVTSLTNEQDNSSPQEWVFSIRPTYATGGRYPQPVNAA